MTDQLAKNVLDYWHSVEFFNYYDLDDEIRQARADEHPAFFLGADAHGAAEWHKYQGQPRQLYLLPFDVGQVVALAGDEADPRDQEFVAEGLSCYAKLRIGADGVPDFNGLSVSTLPWAGGMLLRDKLRCLCAEQFEAGVFDLKQDMASAWSCHDSEQCTPELIAELAQLLTEWAGYAPRGGHLAWVDVLPRTPLAVPRQGSLLAGHTDAGAVGQPLNQPRPQALSQAQVQAQVQFQGDNDDDSRPAPADDLPILNSFYYHDIKQAADTLHAGRAAAPHPLTAYLAGGVEKLDLDTPAGQQAIHAALAPAHNNAGRWPTEPAQLQSLMQQFALNRMRALPPGGLLSVNGPPGTGKTTLVKDLIADLIVQRAGVLAGLARARDGLSGQSEMLAFGNDAPAPVPRLHPALCGFEIVVASSNNGAVENLSLELPQLSGIAADYRATLRYFDAVATKYAGTRAGKPWRKPQQAVWGLVSAALGKSANRQRFQQVFGYNASHPGKRPGERFIKAEQVDQAAWDAEGALTYWRYAKQRKGCVPSFDSARQRFLRARDSHAEFLASQDALRSRWLAFVDAWHAARPVLELHTGLEQGARALAGELDLHIRLCAQQVEQRAAGIWWQPLRWLMRWFAKEKLKHWLDAQASLLLASNLHDQLALIATLQQRTGQSQLWDGRSLDSQHNQQAALWHGAEFNEQRNELFAAAMELHQAFYLEAAPPAVTIAVSNLLSKRVTQGAPLVAWQWLFMLVPVVSSTFASVRTQFRGVDAGSLGWLIVDEAGQAVPQAAVGALLRAQRAVVVGDPLQIEPVVGLPTRLAERLAQAWLGPQAGTGVAADWATHRQSVQTLADRAHADGVRHPQRPGDFIGIPLVMHRRCDNPMFDIANAIAYDGRMRHHAGKAPASAHPVLGRSAWWDVGGACAPGQGKYVAEQGDYLLDQLVRLYAAEARAGRPQLPELYVITPFREVKRGLLALLTDRQQWSARLAPLKLAPPSNLEQLRGHIGTVHTFQGKEADTVFFVLGCDSTRGGAMAWAASKPNLLNVAVTRARRHCYLIGDRGLWGGLPFFQLALQEFVKEEISGGQASAGFVKAEVD